MKTKHGMKRFAGLLALAALLPLSADAEGVLHGRVSFDAGGTLVKGSDESDWSSATVNTLVLSGDTLWVDNGGTTEVEFSGGTFLRMADGSKAEVVGMPPNATVRGWIGSFYIQRLSRSAGVMAFYTPAAIIEIDNDSAVRVDIISEGMTTVSTRWGRTSVRTEGGGGVTAHAGRRVYVQAGMLPSEPTPFDRTDEDSFDRWNRERAEFLATGGKSTPASIAITNDTLGVSDLDRYGEWVYIDKTPYWRPTVVVNYTPYHSGYWNYVGNVGNVWVGNYPFCYVTSHYGYWDYNRVHGWVWSYRPQWSPAWCATVQYGDYFVWAPVNRYYRPVYPYTSSYFNVGGVSFGFLGTSYCHVNSLYLGPSYVYLTNHDPFRRYYNQPNITINIWNINTGDRRPHVRVPYNDSVTTVRDYTPRRRIRGAETLYASGRSAGERVRSLEATSGRETFSRAGRTGRESARTEVNRIDVGSRSRNVRINQEAPDYARATRSNPVVATNARGRQTDESVTLSNSESRQGGGRTRQDSVRGTETETGRTSTPARGGEETVNRSRTARTDMDPGSGTSPVRSRTTAPSRTDERGSVRTETPSERVTETPSVRTRTRAPEAGTGMENRGRTNVESGRPPARTAAPEVSVSGRSSAPRNSDNFVDQAPTVRTTTPARTRTEPRVENSNPGTSRGTRISEPARTEQPRVQAPDRGRTTTVEQPRVQVPDRGRTTTVERAPVETRGNAEYRVSPQSEPRSSGRGQDSGRTYSAPVRESAPTYQAPRNEGGRSVESAPRSGGGESARGGRESASREGGRGR